MDIPDVPNGDGKWDFTKFNIIHCQSFTCNSFLGKTRNMRRGKGEKEEILISERNHTVPIYFVLPFQRLKKRYPE